VVGALGGRWKVVVTDAEYGDLRVEAAVLGERAELVRAHCRTGSEVLAVAADADGLLNQYCPLPAETIAGLGRCRVIARYGVGYDNVDVAAATRRGILVCNVPDYCADEVSDHTLALILCWARRVPWLDAAVRRGVWATRAAGEMRRLRGQTLGLVGFGRMARALAGKARALGLRLLAHDPQVPPEAVRAAGVEPVGLQELLSRADVVSLHVPLGPATRGLVGEAELRAMRPTALLVNTSRGAVVDERALVRALREGWIAGAALDVLEAEPIPPDHPLLRLPNVILTPHVAWYSEESEAELRRKAAENVLRALEGGRPAYAVNPEVLGPTPA
jgi:D-3-phosphoglycerate dehydrogenase